LFKNNPDNEADFCESYKSQILDNDSSKETSSFNIILKVLTILLLLTIIVAVSIYGYNYFQKNNQNKGNVLPPVSMQISDDDLKVIDEEPEETNQVVKNETKELSSVVDPSNHKMKESDIDKIAKDVKIAIAKSEEEQNSTKEANLTKEESLKVPTTSPESKYLEDLADLSKEIDKERK